MKQLLSQEQTKAQHTVYFSKKLIQTARDGGQPAVFEWENKFEAIHKNVTHLQSEQEEADTKLILHAIDTTKDGATSIDICSPDTDVLILPLRRYLEWPKI